MSQPVILFDLPSRDPCKCWSLNPWKTRLLLNFKGIDYKTEWTEYPDIRVKFQDKFPIPEGAATYTIPTVKLPDGKYITDSIKIAEYIEEHYPSPSIHLDSPYVPKIQKLIATLMELGTGLRGVFLALVPERLLNPESVDYWMETRSKMLQRPLSELTADERGGKAWDHAAKSLHEVTRLLKENDGPFFAGKTVTYADFYWAGFLLFFQRFGTEVFEKLISCTGDGEGADNVHLKLLEAVKPWSERDDH
ncbi:uncharacterized protein JN550_012550 [Neoarthrinium moseri]|uniref:uncharacterized protein n=1 Tax=Neoarthrinium moseri TaxID=1658444 RepID=UPI001FDB9DBE|nr:uncharacterized protein JN550_012550 [Neoarthrinium moseri]KAI1858503.1 hypothetical protein JN550_012550 [Neoarthrinium moseri]